MENNFTHASGTDLQTVLSGLDSAIGARRNQKGELIEDVGDEITARSAADTAEANTRAAGDDEVRASEISRAGDTIYGDLTFYTDDSLATQTMSIAPSTGDITTQGQVSALGGLFTIELDPVSSEPIISIDNTGGVETYRFEAETGSLTLLGDLTMADADILMSPGRLVDGVDISALDLRVGAIEIRLPPGGTPFDDIYVNVTGDTMTGPLGMSGNSITGVATLSATTLTGEGSGITNIDGGNIQTNTITSTQIDEDAVGSDEIDEDAVGSSEIATDAVGSDEIDEDAVGSSEIATDAVGSDEIDKDAVGSDEIDDGAIDFDDLGTNGCTNGKVIKFDGTGWVCGDDIDTDTDTNTTYTAGDGLTLTDTEFDVVFGGNGSALTVAHSDHNHDGVYSPTHDHPYAPAGHTHPDPPGVPPEERAFAHGSASGGGGCSGYNISGPGGPFSVGPTMNCDFDTDAPSTDYTIVVTPTGGGCGSEIFLTVTDKDPEDFTVTATCRSGGVTSLWSFDFVVYLK